MPSFARMESLVLKSEAHAFSGGEYSLCSNMLRSISVYDGTPMTGPLDSSGARASCCKSVNVAGHLADLHQIITRLTWSLCLGLRLAGDGF